MAVNRFNHKSSSRRSGPVKKTIFLHHCQACDHRWTALRPMTSCSQCGLDESRNPGTKGICRIKGYTVPGPDGKFYIKLTLKPPTESKVVETPVDSEKPDGQN